MRTDQKGIAAGKGTVTGGGGSDSAGIELTRRVLHDLETVKYTVSIDPQNRVALKLTLDMCEVKGLVDTARGRIDTNPIDLTIKGTYLPSADGEVFLENEAELVVEAIKQTLDIIKEEVRRYSEAHNRDQDFYLTVNFGEQVSHILSTARLKSDCRRFDLGKGVEELTSALDDALIKLSERKPKTVVIGPHPNSENPAAAHSPETLEDLSVNRLEFLLALADREIRITNQSRLRNLDVSKEGVLVTFSDGEQIKITPKIISDPETKKKLGKGNPFVSGIRFDEKDGCCILSISFAPSVAEARKSSMSSRSVGNHLNRASTPKLKQSIPSKKRVGTPPPKPPSIKSTESFPNVKPKQVVACPDCFMGPQGEEQLRKCLRALWSIEGNYKILCYRDASTGKPLVNKGSGEPTSLIYYPSAESLQKFLVENPEAIEYLRFYSWGALITNYIVALDKKGALLEESDFGSLPGMDPKTAYETYAFYFSKGTPTSGRFMAPIVKEHLLTLTAIYLRSLPTQPTSNQEKLLAIQQGIKTGLLPPRKIYDILERYK